MGLTENAPSQPQVTPLLSNETLARLERLRIQSRRRFTMRSRGEHLAGRSGTSTEFCDYRDYVPGDDVRFVDWNIFARLNRPYLKLYHPEEEQHLVLLVDASTSMTFEGKLRRAQELAAAFGVAGLFGGERVSVYAFRRLGEPPHRLPPTTGRAGLLRLFSVIETVPSEGDLAPEESIDQLLRFHVGRGVVVLLSDLLTFGDLDKAFNRLFSAGLEIFGVQILSPSEIHPETPDDLRLVDSESQDTLDVSTAADLLQIYEQHRRSYEDRLATLCRQRSGRFVAISTTDPLEGVLFDLLRRKGWLR